VSNENNLQLINDVNAYLKFSSTSVYEKGMLFLIEAMKNIVQNNEVRSDDLEEIFQDSFPDLSHETTSELIELSIGDDHTTHLFWENENGILRSFFNS